MARLGRLAWLFVIPTLALPLGCSSSKKGKASSGFKTAAQFCDAVAKAACNETVVGKCSGGGTNVDNCIASQSSFCLNEALENSLYYSSANAKECVEAIKDAYADAKLTADEIKVAREFAGAPCDKMLTGSGDVGTACTKNYDCNTAEDLTCVIRPGQATGTCQVPQIVSGGFSCSEPHVVCDTGFYCDGQNCLARPSSEGAACSAALPCSEDFKCLGSDDSAVCTAKSDVGAACTTAVDCKSGVCSASVCVAQVELVTAEPFCADLR